MLSKGLSLSCQNGLRSFLAGGTSEGGLAEGAPRVPLAFRPGAGALDCAFLIMPP